MKLRTDSELLDRLDDELAWRRKEIAILTSLAQSASSEHTNTLIRAGIPLIYAHWEGFVKAGVEAVLCFVSLSGKTYDELAPCFAVYGVKEQLDHITESKKVRVRISAMKFVMSKLNEKVGFGWRDQITTRGNLKFDPFTDVAAAIGIDVSRFETRKPFIDRSLVYRRNAIAHGAQLDLNIAGFVDVADGVAKLLQWFKEDLEEYVSKKSYLRQADVT